jgi:peptide/nickel transport system permease protein
LTRIVGLSGVLFLRLASAFSLLVEASAIIYLTVRMAPGDAVDAITPMGTPDDIKQQLAIDFGLNEGPIGGFFTWLSRVLQGDFGDSLVVAMGSSVTEIAMPAFWITLKLSGLALLGCMLLVLTLAVVMGEPHRKEQIFTAPLYVLTTTPCFITAVFLIHGINSYVRGYVDASTIDGLDWYALGQPSDSIFPVFIAGCALILSDGLFMDYLNALRAELTKLRNAQFIVAARARGASTLPHIARNLWVPLVSSYAARLPLVLGGVVIVEQVFGVEGAGYLLVEAAKSRDFPVVVGVSALFTMTIISVGFLSSLVKLLADPREIAHGA